MGAGLEPPFDYDCDTIYDQLAHLNVFQQRQFDVINRAHLSISIILTILIISMKKIKIKPMFA